MTAQIKCRFFNSPALALARTVLSFQVVTCSRKLIQALIMCSALLVIVSSSLFSLQSGFKYMRNYKAEDYKWHPQNWMILQDKRGLIYVANQGGLLEFDGVNWRRIVIPNMTVRSMAMDDDTGTIYIGGTHEFGLLAEDKNGKGKLKFQSLLNQVDQKHRNFKNVLGTHCTPQGTYFRTYYHLFKWQNNRLELIEETGKEHRFRGSYLYRDKVYVRKDKVGLMRLDNDRLVLIPGGEMFASKPIYLLVPFADRQILIGTRSFGMFVFDGKNQITPIKTDADNYLENNQLYYGTRLVCGDYALATRRGGIIITGPSGEIKDKYRQSEGLIENYVRYIFEDSQGNLWIAQDKGITKIEHHSPIGVFDERSGLNGITLSVAMTGHTRTLYVGTTSGLFSLDDTAKFIPLPGMTQQCYDLLAVNDDVLAAADGGIFQVNKEAIRNIAGSRCYVLYQSRKAKNKVWAGTSGGLIVLGPGGEDAAVWKLEKEFKEVNEEVHSIAEDEKGDVWLGTTANIVVRLHISDSDKNSPLQVTRMMIPDDLDPQYVHTTFAASHVMFATSKGLYRYAGEQHKIIPDLTLGEKYAGGATAVFRVAEDRNRHIWFHSRFRNLEAVLRPDGSYLVPKTALLRIPDAQVNVIYPDPVEAVVWFGGNDGLIRFDTALKKEHHLDFPVYIRTVQVNGEPVFNGGRSAGRMMILPYKKRNLRFNFAAPFFENEAVTRYQTFLEGYDEQWSKLITETRKDYTNLDSGTYTFRVKAENVYKVTSSEADFSFKILPPWYFTWWAKGLYIIIAFLLLALLVRWRSSRLQQEKNRLEQIVHQRTAEIEEKNEQLETQTIQLKEQSEKLSEMDKIKTRFFTNISHEFRTPLTLIMGPLEEMLADKESGSGSNLQKSHLSMMLRNSRRLLGLINQLLELSKIESGKMTIQPTLQNFVPFIKGIVASFEPIIDKKKLLFTFNCQEEKIISCFDPARMEDVIFNLLSNAAKFTPPGGSIDLSLTQNPPNDREFPSGSLSFSVRDSGPGIPREQVPRIFDRFYQSDGTHEHHGKGSGIGLTIVKELVDLHHGAIDVHSHEGKGTEFIIHLPLGTQQGNVEWSGPLHTSTIEEKVKMIDFLPEETDTEMPADFNDSGETVKNIVLVVEDSADARTYIRAAMEPEYTIIEAKDGKVGIAMALEHIPDLIVSDIMMPEVDGYELCRTLKLHVNTSHIPIILLTAKAGEEDVLEGLQTGADDYITKPFNTKILSARIKNLIDQRSHLQQALDRDMTIQPTKMPVSKIDKDFIIALKHVLKENISNPEFNVEELCRQMEMSQPTLYRKIQALSGESPTEFIRSYRLKRAARLLEENFGSVIEVALEVGFSSAAYFTKCFKKKFNRVPSHYIEENNT